MSVFLPIAVFYAVLLTLALWGAWLGWTRSKSPTARYFTVIMALVWAVFIALEAWNSYQLFNKTGIAEIVATELNDPLYGSFGSCSLCYEGPASNVYVVAASRMSNGHYVFAAETKYALRFDSGIVEFNGKPLDPGCYSGEAKIGDAVEVVEARNLRLEAGSSASCD